MKLLTPLLSAAFATEPEDRRRLTRPSAGVQKLLRLRDHLPMLDPVARYNVTISHSHRLVWFRVAKVGTRTIFETLRQAGVALDMEEPFGVSAPRAATPGYVRAAFVRHPIERFLSGWQSTVLKMNYFNFDDATYASMHELDVFMEWLLAQDPDACDPHFRRQDALVPDEPLDLLGRMETFTEDLGRLIELIGASVPDAEHLNRSPKKAPELSSAQHKRLVDFYKPDFARFSYSP